MALEKTLESPLDCKEIQPVNSKGDRSWVFIGRTDAKAETPILWPPHEKSWLIGKDWCWEGLGAGEEGDDRGRDAGWHRRLDGCESQWTPGVGDGQGGLACCNSWGRKESDTTEQLNWTELNAHIQNLGKWFWRIYLQGSKGKTDIENIFMDIGRGEERVRCIERITRKHTFFF